MNNDRGLIGFFGLDEWFDKFTEDEKQKFRDYYFMPVGLSYTISISPDLSPSITQGKGEEDISVIELGDPTEYINSISPKLTRVTFLQGIGNNALFLKDFDFAEKIYQKALETEDVNPISRHFIYNHLIDLYYKLRDEKPDALLKCIKYCEEDIKYLNDFLNAYKNEEEQMKWLKENTKDWEDPLLKRSLSQGIYYPCIPSLERLAIIYDKQGKIEDAIKICDMGLRYELRDSTKGGFEGRKTRLIKKLESIKNISEPIKDYYNLERKANEIKKSKQKDVRPKIPYNSSLLDYNFSINFSLTKSQWADMDYVNYWNMLVENLFNLINKAAGREIAFIGFRKNYPMPIVTTYNRVSENPEYDVNRVTIDLEVFTDDNCSKFVDEIYNFLTSLKACNEISSIDIKQPWLPSKSKDNIDRTHIETEFKINFK